MKKLFLLSTAVVFFAAASVQACESQAVHAVKVLSQCQVRVVTVDPVPAIEGIVELRDIPKIADVIELRDIPKIADVIELKDIPKIAKLSPVPVAEFRKLVADAGSAVYQVSVAAEPQPDDTSSHSVALTVLSAVGKALLKAIATLIHNVV